jgi:hypothetical protein
MRIALATDAWHPALPLGHSSAMIGGIGARQAQRQNGDAS